MVKLGNRRNQVRFLSSSSTLLGLASAMLLETTSQRLVRSVTSMSFRIYHFAQSSRTNSDMAVALCFRTFPSGRLTCPTHLMLHRADRLFSTSDRHGILMLTLVNSMVFCGGACSGSRSECEKRPIQLELTPEMTCLVRTWCCC